MAKAERYRSEPLEALHKTRADLHEIGVIDKTTMRHFDIGCLTPVRDLDAEAIRTIREKSHLSQAAFAVALNVPKSLISQWERGEKRPSGPSLKLLSLIEAKGIDAIL